MALGQKNVQENKIEQIIYKKGVQFQYRQKIKKHNEHQYNTDEGGQAMGEDINITQMMVGMWTGKR